MTISNGKLAFLLIVNTIFAVMLVVSFNLYSSKLNFFPWGNTDNDGLSFLVLPICIGPIMILLSICKYLIIRTLEINLFYKTNYLIIALLSVSPILIDLNLTPEILWLGIVGVIASVIILTMDFFKIAKLKR